MSADRAQSSGEETLTPSRETNAWKSSPFTGLIFALMSGLLMFLILHQLHPVFAREEERDSFGNLPTAIQNELDWQNATFVFALLGGLIAAGLAVAEGFARKSLVTMIVFGVLCAVGGALFGAGAGYLGNILFKYLQKHPLISDLYAAMFVYIAVLGMVGAGVGCAVGVLLGRSGGTAANCLLGGMLAGIGAGLAYPVICALAIPATETKVLIPIGATDRILWSLLTAGLIGLIIPALASKRAKK